MIGWEDDRIVGVGSGDEYIMCIFIICQSSERFNSLNDNTYSWYIPPTQQSLTIIHSISISSHGLTITIPLHIWYYDYTYSRLLDLGFEEQLASIVKILRAGYDVESYPGDNIPDSNNDNNTVNDKKSLQVILTSATLQESTYKLAGMNIVSLSVYISICLSVYPSQWMTNLVNIFYYLIYYTSYRLCVEQSYVCRSESGRWSR